MNSTSIGLVDLEVNKLLTEVLAMLENAKGVDPKVLKISEKSALADYFVIVSGNSKTHVRAIFRNIVEKTKMLRLKTIGVEGHEDNQWVLVDFGDIVVHIMDKESRDKYQLRIFGKALRLIQPKEYL